MGGDERDGMLLALPAAQGLGLQPPVAFGSV